MTRQTILGYLFLVLGLFVALVMLAPLVAAAIHSQPTTITMTAVVMLSIGIGVSVYGAFLLPSSGAKTALHELSIELKESSLPVVGGHGTTTATATLKEVETPKAGPS
jgi:Na+/glutamate symporter